MREGRKILYLVLVCLALTAQAQSDIIDIGETKEEYIRTNHLDDIEALVHQFTASKKFLNYLLEQGHDIDPNTVDIRRKEVGIGEDIDIYVKHFTEHQNFSMLMIPVSIYNLAIYDTLLFSVLEVSDEWMRNNFYRNDLTNDSIKSQLLTLENHNLLTKHMYEQAMKGNTEAITEIEIALHESYMSTSSIHMHVDQLDAQEKKEFRRSWGLMKKLFTHDVNMNVEMNVYIFGHDDMQVIFETKKGKNVFRITPGNVFVRHHFQGD